MLLVVARILRQSQATAHHTILYPRMANVDFNISSVAMVKGPEWSYVTAQYHGGNHGGSVGRVDR